MSRLNPGKDRGYALNILILISFHNGKTLLLQDLDLLWNHEFCYPSKDPEGERRAISFYDFKLKRDFFSWDWKSHLAIYITSCVQCLFLMLHCCSCFKFNLNFELQNLIPLRPGTPDGPTEALRCFLQNTKHLWCWRYVCVSVIQNLLSCLWTNFLHQILWLSTAKLLSVPPLVADGKFQNQHFTTVPRDIHSHPLWLEMKKKVCSLWEPCRCCQDKTICTCTNAYFTDRCFLQVFPCWQLHSCFKTGCYGK